MSRRNARHPRGFTLIELLVVIAIIAILIGLLLPAVQKVREAAARMKCSNNLKQLAIAVHSYHDANSRFPYSAGPGYAFNATGTNSWSWIARTLPYIEQGNLYAAGGLGSNPMPSLASVPAVVATQIPTFQCPSDPNSSTARTDTADISPTVSTVGITNYKGVCGNNWGWGANAYTPPSGSYNGLDAGNGIFYRTDYNRSLTMTSITDGTSNTLMIGEDLIAINKWAAWPYFNAATGTCAIPLNNALVAGQPGYGNPGDWPDVYSFRSRHTNGANFALADGSVRFVNQSISLTTYRNAATYAGGEVLGSDW
jgi:prepilin-type N-terminal cleavage/methylation domain-containing protein/prepilin-type processing-associated H-X9-DG protein